ncbi:hypothetical protein PR048_008413 [Dryococelus australis]|uniref:Uncharacterized protein n=1 Tax=Dryococelus australis TaxID=614101 RepID=A0ABQ9HX16_9NEOP|nr:hypothetical protein PR048_008413 [Dryococelus australis]
MRLSHLSLQGRPDEVHDIIVIGHFIDAITDTGTASGTCGCTPQHAGLHDPSTGDGVCKTGGHPPKVRYANNKDTEGDADLALRNIASKVHAKELRRPQPNGAIVGHVERAHESLLPTTEGVGKEEIRCPAHTAPHSSGRSLWNGASEAMAHLSSGSGDSGPMEDVPRVAKNQLHELKNGSEEVDKSYQCFRVRRMRIQPQLAASIATHLAVAPLCSTCQTTVNSNFTLNCALWWSRMISDQIFNLSSDLVPWPAEARHRSDTHEAQGRMMYMLSALKFGRHPKLPAKEFTVSLHACGHPGPPLPARASVPAPTAIQESLVGAKAKQMCACHETCWDFNFIFSDPYFCLCNQEPFYFAPAAGLAVLLTRRARMSTTHLSRCLVDTAAFTPQQWCDFPPHHTKGSQDQRLGLPSEERQVIPTTATNPAAWELIVEVAMHFCVPMRQGPILLEH